MPASDPCSYEVIYLGGEAAAIVPPGDLRQLRALQRHTSPELLEQAETEAHARGAPGVGGGRPARSGLA